MPVTPEGVANTYRWLLRRESDEAGSTTWPSTDSREELRRASAASPEFRRVVLQLPPLPASNVAAERAPLLVALNYVECLSEPDPI